MRTIIYLTSALFVFFSVAGLYLGISSYLLLRDYEKNEKTFLKKTIERIATWEIDEASFVLPESILIRSGIPEDFGILKKLGQFRKINKLEQTGYVTSIGLNSFLSASYKSNIAFENGNAEMYFSVTFNNGDYKITSLYIEPQVFLSLKTGVKRGDIRSSGRMQERGIKERGKRGQIHI